ncbi:MAG: AMP-binding protein [Desulfovibrionaceae bacterium]|nr:AMP-binding protein [Desulfovibrionaceae bacterium]
MQHSFLCLDGRKYGPEDIGALLRLAEEGRPELADLAHFLADWFSPSESVPVQTSGSTGAPKRFMAPKARMRASAGLTCDFLRLKEGDSALLCMPLKYIGAKMVVVRALERGLDLRCVQPSSHPLRGMAESLDFAAMTPAQVYTTLEVPEEAETLKKVRHLIIGGGAVNGPLAESLRAFPNAVWSTYGMTETLSHIALRRLNGPEASEWYTPFSGVSVRLAEDGALCILAPAVCEGELVTNDLAELDAAGRFRILGRKDNVINSGGVKVQIEAVEAALAPHIEGAFFITSVPDAQYGEMVVMLREGSGGEGCLAACRRVLHPYACPKRVFTVPSLPRTGSGKPDRAGARRLAGELAKAGGAGALSD